MIRKSFLWFSLESFLEYDHQNKAETITVVLQPTFVSFLKSSI